MTRYPVTDLYRELSALPEINERILAIQTEIQRAQAEAA